MPPSFRHAALTAEPRPFGERRMTRRVEIIRGGLDVSGSHSYLIDVVRTPSSTLDVRVRAGERPAFPAFKIGGEIVA